ncbi:methyl-accepting chemotaxis protein [Clostridium folliculivorans]|uniref:Methyl-accepting chemotaxis protein n=1 Tax=Clostridium folliculivorans TaxID=2886038 RepID=A0A9W5Y422_9CLOT|nr:methyl-accepting chemotaxis protein [Clostridium folliculivorans]GKU26170.1 methyl-accepting chemotaxis protein [Clostridium folliculivorans]GKU31842.1 methyl-accepting chemotaxis protein [Clostridium folliculivorans]
MIVLIVALVGSILLNLVLMYKSINQSRSIEEVKGALINIKEGCIPKKIQLGNKRLTKKSLVEVTNGIIDRLSKFNYEVEVTSAQIAAVSGELSDSVVDNNEFMQNLYEEAEKIGCINDDSSNKVKETVKDINEISNMVNKIIEASNDLLNINNNSTTSIQENLSVVEELVKIVGEVNESSSKTRSIINELNNTSEEINYILNTVSGFAKQTNLLALNATIESAKAGEFGKSFGVVATEIEKLSKNSNEAVSSIYKLINSIKKSILDVTNIVSKDMELISTGFSYSQHIEYGLSQINESLNSVDEQIETILNLTKRQYDFTNDIKNKSIYLENSSKEVKDGFKVLYKGINEQVGRTMSLEELSKGLLQYVDSIEHNTIRDSKDDDIKDMIYEICKKAVNVVSTELLSNSYFSNLDKKEHKEMLDKVLLKNAFIEAIWTNDQKGKFIYSNPTNGIVNARSRKWFLASIEGKEYISDKYISSITKNPCVTVSLPIKDNKNNITGVLGLDIKIV